MGTTSLTLFENETFGSIRSFEIDGEPWFVAKDIAGALEYSATEAMTRRLDDDEKGMSTYSTYGGIQNISIINESGLYSVILKSSKNKAKAMQRWITSEVIPSARKMAEIIKALNEFEIPDDLPDMYVYAIREKQTGNIKIGISKDPEERLKQLQIGNSSDLELVTYKKADNRFKDEKALHLGAMAYHIRGEWFNECAMEVMQ